MKCSLVLLLLADLCSGIPWTAHLHEGRTYYYNTETGQTQWAVPSEGFITPGDANRPHPGPNPGPHSTHTSQGGVGGGMRGMRSRGMPRGNGNNKSGGTATSSGSSSSSSSSHSSSGSDNGGPLIDNNQESPAVPIESTKPNREAVLEDEIQDLTAKIDALRAEYDEVQFQAEADKSNLESDLEAVREARGALEKRLEEALVLTSTSSSSSDRDLLQSLEQENEDLHCALKALRAEQSSAAGNVDRWETRMGTLEAELNDAYDEIGRLEHDLEIETAAKTDSGARRVQLHKLALREGLAGNKEGDAEGEKKETRKKKKKKEQLQQQQQQQQQEGKGKEKVPLWTRMWELLGEGRAGGDHDMANRVRRGDRGAGGILGLELNPNRSAGGNKGKAPSAVLGASSPSRRGRGGGGGGGSTKRRPGSALRRSGSGSGSGSGRSASQRVASREAQVRKLQSSLASLRQRLSAKTVSLEERELAMEVMLRSQQAFEQRMLRLDQAEAERQQALELSQAEKAALATCAARLEQELEVERVQGEARVVALQTCVDRLRTELAAQGVTMAAVEEDAVAEQVRLQALLDRSHVDLHNATSVCQILQGRVQTLEQELQVYLDSPGLWGWLLQLLGLKEKRAV